MSLVNEIIKGLLPEDEKRKVVAVYGGGFKPPTAGHFEVAQQALKENPEIDEFIIYIGGKERNGISPDESILIWDIYKQYLPYKVEVKYTSVPPIKSIYNYAKEHPDEDVLFVIGAREGNEDDFSDIAKRTTSLDKYPNLNLRTIVTQGGVSGTAARNASKISLDKFKPFVPSELSDEEVEEVYNIVADKIQENEPEDGKAAPYGSGYKKLNENASYKEYIGIQDKIDQLTDHMISKGMNIEPLPSLEFVDGDSENAKDFFGKTAYYDPNRQHIVLYTEGRHPKDIVRSYAHEMIHHIQHLEDRLGDISGTDTTSDEHLTKLEKEANLRGTMTFRNWTDSLNEDIAKNTNQIYHWTSYLACKKIIESNKLKSNLSNQFFEYDESRDLPDYKNVVFFTVENERFADEENSNQCILVIDKSKLSKDYKTISYGDPYEETIVYTNDSSIPVLSYLKGVILMNTLQKSSVKKMVQFLESKSIPYEINDTLEKEVKAKRAKLPTLKKELVNKLKLKYPNGFIGYLNTPLISKQTPEYFKSNPTYSYPHITINKPGEYGEKNKFQVKFEIKPQNLEKYINWFMYSPDSIEDLINMDDYEGEELYFKGDIPIDINTLQEAVVGDKIECDNCDWSWDISSGGDDLYTCHKCWHDNTPIEENKDPFGINAYARELGQLNEKVMDYKIYCDMDGVIADFELGYKELTGIDLQVKKPEGEEFWDPISKAGVGFWAGLKWMPGGQKLWDYLKPFNPQLLSAPSREQSSRIGKAVWVKHKIPGTKLILRYAKQKQQLATPNSILIDDRQVNIDQWEAAGGIGILHTNTANTIKQLKQLGL